MKKYWYFVSYAYSVWETIETEIGTITLKTPVIGNGEIWRPYQLDNYDLINREVKIAVTKKLSNVENLIVIGCSLMRVEE